MFIGGLGAVFFGLSMGWLACRILRQQASIPWRHNLIALLGIIAGAAVLAFFRDEIIFGWYVIGLVVSLAADVILHGKQDLPLLSVGEASFDFHV
jgi:hypothetical protein